MLKLFHVLFGKQQLKKEKKEGTIVQEMDTGYDEILKLYEEWREKSVRDNCCYGTGSPYIKQMIDDKLPPECIMNYFLSRSLKDDPKKPSIPLELGNMIYQMSIDPNYHLGMHRSYMIISDDVFEDKALHSILTEGLINAGAGMQGMFSSGPPYPSQTVAPAGDFIHALHMMKYSFRGSRGAVLVRLPRDIVQFTLDFKKGADYEAIYEKRGPTYYIKPEYIIGYIDSSGEECKFYSREELLKNYKGKEL